MLAERTLAARAALGANGGSLTNRVLALLRPASTRRATFSRLIASVAIAAALAIASGTSLANVASREAEARWLSRRTLGESVAAILDRPHASPEEQAAAAELLEMTSDRSIGGTTALVREIITAATLERVAHDAPTRRRLVNAAMFENDRCLAMTQRFNAVAATPVDGRAWPEFLSDLRMSRSAQSFIASMARTKLDRNKVLELATLSARLHPAGELSIWVSRLREPPSASPEYGEIWLTSPPRKLPRPPRIRPTTRPTAATTRPA
jgi:hypothetical protein